MNLIKKYNDWRDRRFSKRMRTYLDGDCYSLVNLRPKNGALEPVAPRKVIKELSDSYDLVFVHQNNNYKKRIKMLAYGKT